MELQWIKDQAEYFSNMTQTSSTLTSSKVLDMSKPTSFVNMVTSSANRSLKSAHSSSIDSGTWMIFFYSIIFLLAVIGNLLVILTLIQSRRMRTITNLFLLNLAISDLFLGVFCMPFTLVGMLLREFIFGEVMCKLLPYLQGKHKWCGIILKVLKFVILCKFVRKMEKKLRDDIRERVYFGHHNKWPINFCAWTGKIINKARRKSIKSREIITL
jgi:hypothetical protein